jgi:hypothetical protein
MVTSQDDTHPALSWANTPSFEEITGLLTALEHP